MNQHIHHVEVVGCCKVHPLRLPTISRVTFSTSESEQNSKRRLIISRKKHVQINICLSCICIYIYNHIQSVYECIWCVLCLLWYIVRNNINKQRKCKWQGQTKSSTLEHFLLVTLWMEQGTRNQHWYHHFITSIFQSWFVMWCQHLIFISPGWFMRGSPKIVALATQEVPPQCNSIVAYLAFTVWLLGTWLTLLRWEPKSTQEIIPCPQCFKAMFHTQWENRGLVLDLLLIYGVYWRPKNPGAFVARRPVPYLLRFAPIWRPTSRRSCKLVPHSWVTWFDLY